jgi:hypothetical protein
LFEYQTLFDARGDLYSRANRRYPEARPEEAAAPSIHAESVRLLWTFDSPDDAALFCRDLFGLAPSTADAEMRRALDDLGATGGAGGFRTPWTMQHVSAARA